MADKKKKKQPQKQTAKRTSSTKKPDRAKKQTPAAKTTAKKPPIKKLSEQYIDRNGKTQTIVEGDKVIIMLYDTNKKPIKLDDKGMAPHEVLKRNGRLGIIWGARDEFTPLSGFHATMQNLSKPEEKVARVTTKSTTNQTKPAANYHCTSITQRRIKRYQDTIKELQAEKQRFAQKTDVISRDNVKAINATINSLKDSIARLTNK